MNDSRAAANKKRLTTHGQYHTPEYKVWASMKQRCLDTRHKQYPEYGQRGIDICPTWYAFEDFIADMGKRPSDAHTLERMDNNRGYHPDNCQWKTRKHQANNTRQNTLLTLNGITQTLAQWADAIGVKHSTMCMRLYSLKWPIEKALTTPTQKRGN